jgi:F420-0:gamma-glutamyl ligase
MKRDVARWVLLFPFVAALAACASSGSKVVADVAPAPAATAVARPAPVAMTAPATASAVAAEADAGAKVGDYRLVVRQGEEFYCKRAGVTGSRVSSKEICMTRDQMQKSREGNQQTLREMQGNGALNGINLGQ